MAKNAKSLKDKIFIAVFRVAGVILLLLGIRMMAEGVLNYIDEHCQEDWVTQTAYVIDVSDEYRSGGGRHRSRTVYDITYQYEVDGESYTGRIFNQSKPLSRGDAVTIKYDPSSPESSTYILKPYMGALILFFAVGAMMTAAGFFMTGLWALIRRIRGGEDDGEEELPPEEYVDTGSIGKSRRRPAPAIGAVIVFAVLLIFAVYTTVKNPRQIQAVDTEQFRVAMEAEGYAVDDTTKKLSEEWGIGSMLEQAFSYDDGSIRIDFCLMQTENYANRLYDGMTLPGFGGSVSEVSGRGYEMRSVEGDELYAEKIRVGDTVVYISALTEYKSTVQEIMEEIGYAK